MAGAEGLEMPLRNIVALLAWSASHCSLFLHLSGMPFSATGGGTPLRPGTLRVPLVHPYISKNKALLTQCFVFWQGQKDLNPRHAVLETAALPTELYPYIKLVGHQGLEPRTNRL